MHGREKQIKETKSGGKQVRHLVRPVYVFGTPSNCNAAGGKRYCVRAATRRSRAAAAK